MIDGQTLKLWSLYYFRVERSVKFGGFLDLFCFSLVIYYKTVEVKLKQSPKDFHFTTYLRKYYHI